MATRARKSTPWPSEAQSHFERMLGNPSHCCCCRKHTEARLACSAAISRQAYVLCTSESLRHDIVLTTLALKSQHCSTHSITQKHTKHIVSVQQTIRPLPQVGAMQLANSVALHEVTYTHSPQPPLQPYGSCTLMTAGIGKPNDLL